MVGSTTTDATAAANSVRAAVRRRPSRVVDLAVTRQSVAARTAAVRVGTQRLSGVRDGAVAAASVVRTATARPTRRPAGTANVVGRAVPRSSINRTFRGGVGTRGRGRGYGSWYGTSASYGYRFPYDGGRVRLGRSYGYSGRTYYQSYSYRSRYYGASHYPRYGFNLGFSFGSMYGYNSYGYPYYPYDYASNAYGQNYANPYMGSLRLKMKPRDAKVFVDGYYVGLVDHFDGFSQRLRLEEGKYHIEIHHPEYLQIDFDVLIVGGQTVTFEGHMVRP